MTFNFFCCKCGWYQTEPASYSTFNLRPTTCRNCLAKAERAAESPKRNWFMRLFGLYPRPWREWHVSDNPEGYQRPKLVTDCWEMITDVYGRPHLIMLPDGSMHDQHLKVSDIKSLFSQVRVDLMHINVGFGIHIRLSRQSTDGDFFNGQVFIHVNGRLTFDAQLQTKLDAIWLNHAFVGIFPDGDVEAIMTAQESIKEASYSIVTRERCPNSTLPEDVLKKARDKACPPAPFGPDSFEARMRAAMGMPPVAEGESPQSFAEFLQEVVSNAVEGSYEMPAERKCEIKINVEGDVDNIGKLMRRVHDDYWKVNVSGKNRTFSGLAATDDGPQRPLREGSKDAEPRTEASPFVDPERLKVINESGQVIGHAVLDRELCSAVEGVPGAFSMGYKVEGSVEPKAPVAVEHAIFRSRFEGWVLSIKHPVLGFLDRHWFDRSDDGEGYANEYVQGLWVAAQAFSHHVDDNGVVAHRIRYLDGDLGPWRDGPPDYGDEMDAAERVIDGFQCAYNKPWPDGFFVCLPPQEAFANWGVYQSWRMDEMKRYQESGVTLLTTLPAKWRG